MRIDNLVFECFGSTFEFIRAVNSRPDSKTCPGDSSKTNSREFNGGLSYDDAVEVIKTGLPDVCKRLNADLSKFKATGSISVGNKSVPRNYYYGSKPNVPAALAGKPKSMRQRQRQPQKVKTVRVVYDACMNASTEAETLQKSGSTVLCLVYALEKAGYRVKFDLLPYTGTSDRETAFALVNLKEFRQPLDLLKLSFPMTHPAMFRRFGFRWLETVDELKTKFIGYGRHISKESLTESLLRSKQLDDNGYLIQVDDVISSGFDVKELANSIGMVI